MSLERFFPYGTFRIGQRELAASVYEACCKGDRLVVEAMSGFGKTAAVLSGSLLAAEQNDLKIVYLCRTKRQIFRVTEEVSEIQKKVLLPSTHLFSKFDYCLLRRQHPHIASESFKWYCSFNVTNNLCSYFLNVSLLPKEMAELVRVSSQSLLMHQALLEKSQRLHICPYEVVRLGIPNARIVTATYHYLFEEASKSLLFTGTQLDPRRTVVVFDEAHNLRDFVRGITTTTISFDELELSVRDAQSLFFGKIGSSINLFLQRTKQFCQEHDGWHLDKESFVRDITRGLDEVWLSNLAFELTACAGAAWHSISGGSNPPNSVLKVGKFLTNLLASVKEESKILAKSDSSLIIVNADPAKAFLESTGTFRSVILLSATINPSELFLKSLGLEKQSTTLHRAKSTESLQIKTILDAGVTTRFKLRTAEMYLKIAEKIIAVIESSNGGIGIFAPSYAVLGSLKELIENRVNNKRILIEARGLTNEQAGEMMADFKATPGSILLAVQGGRFSEGEDFRGEQMDISVVVGLALPPPSPLIYAEYAYLGKTDPRISYMMVSLLPALRKAFQSAGRHIRNPNKKGMVLLLDSRFKGKAIIDLMPNWLKQDLVIGDFPPATISQMVQGFEFTSA